MDFDNLGAKFWLKMFGAFILGAIVLFICLMVFLHAIYAWGIFAAFLVLAGIALVFAWFKDRRDVARYKEATKSAD